MVNEQPLGLETLKNIFRSDAYVKELTELSAYGAHIKQERPMCYLLAKRLFKMGFINLALEKKNARNHRYDLVVGKTTIEAKFYYESDLVFRLKKELKKYGCDIDLLNAKRDSLIREDKSRSWSMALKIIEDMLLKVPDIFLLIILSRDLRSTRMPLENVCGVK